MPAVSEMGWGKEGHTLGREVKGLAPSPNRERGALERENKQMQESSSDGRNFLWERNAGHRRWAGSSLETRRNLFSLRAKKDGCGPRQALECGWGKELRQFMPRSLQIPQGKPYVSSPSWEVPQRVHLCRLQGAGPSSNCS